MKDLDTRLLPIPEAEDEPEDLLHKGLRILAQIIARQVPAAGEPEPECPAEGAEQEEASG